jgi:Arc/MetJ-type ribon-helix-helix transcriptional regulator
LPGGFFVWPLRVANKAGPLTMSSIKVYLSQHEEIQLRQMTSRQGLSVSEGGRRAIKKLIASPESNSENPEAIVDQLERRNGQGKRITATYLSPPLAGAVRKLAAEKKCSQSHVVRDLLRTALRDRGLLPSGQWGAADVIAERNHQDTDDATAAPQALLANQQDAV